MQFLVPFTVFVHTVCSTQTLELILVRTAAVQLFPFAHVHGYIIHVSDLQFRDPLMASGTLLLVPVQHIDPLTTLTVVHVHHSEFPFSD